MTEPRILFVETQRFTHWWVWMVILAAAAWFSYIAYRQLILGEAHGTNPAPDAVLLVAWLLVGVGLPALFGLAHLRTEVGDDGIHVRFFPFHLRPRRFGWDEIAEAYARSYSAMGEYGGWGIRVGFAGWAYNVRGDRGVQLVLRSGQRVLIGTQRPDALLEAIGRARADASAGPAR